MGPDPNASVAAQYSWAMRLSSSYWTLSAALAVVALWFIAFLYTRDADDQSKAGIPVEAKKHMAGDDNRKGIFNDAPNYGSQTYNEGPTRRDAPSLAQALSRFSASGLQVQVRVYGMNHEMQRFGQALGRELAKSGLQVIQFGQDHGTRYIEGVIIEPTANADATQFAHVLADKLRAEGIKVKLGSAPSSWRSDPFVRIAVGGID